MNNVNSPIPSEQDFQCLLLKTQSILEAKWKKENCNIQSISPDEFEKHVTVALNQAAEGTAFENTIKLITGHKFPDISVSDRYGVEVKTTKSNHWKTLGNSVLESTRVPGIETIYIFFAQLLKNPQLKFRKYQDCLSEVQITHSPRYIIDMELPEGESIFDKIGIDYNVVRLQERPISLFIDYYKRILGKDTSVWWISNDQMEKAVPMQIQFWADLEQAEKRRLMGHMLFLFPEVFDSRSSTKYKKPVVWLVKNYSVVSTCMRDDFSAGGRINLEIGNEKLSVPQVIGRLLSYKDDFQEAIKNCSWEDVKEYLAPAPDVSDSYENRFSLWFLRFCQAIQGSSLDSDIFKKYVNDVFSAN